MTHHVKKEKTAEKKTSRRGFLKTAAVTGAAAGSLGFPAVLRAATADPIKIRIQTVWDAGTLGYVKFQDFCRSVGEVSEGKVIFEGLRAGEVVETFQMFDAVKAGIIDAMHCFDAYWSGKIPVATFLSSYPFGLDRPDQWETWHYELGGNLFAQEAYGRQNMHYIGPIQHDDSLIHSRVPIRSFEDFQGKKIRFPAGIIADIYQAAGVATVLLPGSEIYPALEKGDIDASDYVGAAINYNMGFGEIAKYIIMGPPSRPCLHQPVDIMSVEINMRTWERIPRHYRQLITMAVRKHSYDQYAAIQAADIVAFERMQMEQGVEVIRLTEEDISKFRRYAPSLWVKWAKKSPLAMKAFRSQFEYMKSVKVGYITDADMVDPDGQALIF